MTNKHIRPQKRQVAAKKAPSETGRSSVQQQQPHESQPPPPTTLPKSILKLSKYGGVRRIDQDEEVVATSDSIIRDDIVQEKLRTMAAVTAANDMLSPSLAIDGYTPKLSVAAAAEAATTTTSTTTKSRESKSASTSDEDHDDKDVNNDDEPPLVFGSLSQLMETAGTLPSQDDNPESAAMIEADLAFRCMDRETFKDYQQMKEAEYYEACLGRPIGLVYKINDDGNNNDAYSETDHTDENTDPSLEEDALWFGDDECDDEEDDPAENRPPRLFAILHAAVSQWVTPQAVDYVRELRDDDHNQQRQHKDRPCAYDKTDLGVSRCTGLQALLKMHCQRCWQEILVSKQSEAVAASNQRLAEQRLGELLRCFDYGQPSPKLSTAQTKALTCVLLDIAMQKELDDGIGGNNAVPTCCELQGMAMDEYMYLTRSAFASFGAPAEDDE